MVTERFRSGKPTKIAPLTPAKFKAKSKWRMGVKVAGFSTIQYELANVNQLSFQPFLHFQSQISLIRQTIKNDRIHRQDIYCIGVVVEYNSFRNQSGSTIVIKTFC